MTSLNLLRPFWRWMLSNLRRMTLLWLQRSPTWALVSSHFLHFFFLFSPSLCQFQIPFKNFSFFRVLIFHVLAIASSEIPFFYLNFKFPFFVSKILGFKSLSLVLNVTHFNNEQKPLGRCGAWSTTWRMQHYRIGRASPPTYPLTKRIQTFNPFSDVGLIRFDIPS